MHAKVIMQTFSWILMNWYHIATTGMPEDGASVPNKNQYWFTQIL
jgi:hypothetical protein